MHSMRTRWRKYNRVLEGIHINTGPRRSYLFTHSARSTPKFIQRDKYYSLLFQSSQTPILRKKTSTLFDFRHPQRNNETHDPPPRPRHRIQRPRRRMHIRPALPERETVLPRRQHRRRQRHRGPVCRTLGQPPPLRRMPCRDESVVRERREQP